MTDAAPDRLADIERVFHAARAMDARARAAYLADACGADEAFRAEVDSLLKFDTAAGAFLTRPALEHAARAITPQPAGVLAGRQIHGYEIRSLLGAGGMGEVYLARDLRLGRDVALKVLQRSRAHDPRYLRRFEDEARSASVLNHPNIVTIYGVGEDGDVSYIAMERVLGRTLREVVGAADLATPAVVDLAVQLADALAVAHDNGIVHRDLKPENVMVTPEGRLKVLDFGIAKREGAVLTEAEPDVTELSRTEAMSMATQAGTILGTVGYMSPEQAEGRSAGPASDQFSFGAMLYELLAGRRAFDRPSKAATLEAIRRDAPPPLRVINANVPASLQRLVDRCLAKDPAERYPRSRAIAAELREIQERLNGGGFSRRQVLWYGATAGAALAAAAGVGWWIWPRGPRVQALAILPFENPAHDSDIDPVCDGLSAELIRSIGVLPSIRVMTHSLVSNFAKSGLDARTFARRVQADGVVTGSITRHGGEVTVAASLVEVESGKTVWSNTYTRAGNDLQVVQTAIASEMARDGIRLQLSEQDRDRLLRRVTDNAEAYEQYLRAVSFHERGTPDDERTARECFERAIALDPKFARAYAALAATYAAAAIDGFESPADAWPASHENIRAALDRDPDLPDAHAALAEFYFFCNWEFAAADREWSLAMRSRGAEMFPFLRVSRALQQWALGHTPEALRLIREVRASDPLSPRFIVTEAGYLQQDGQWEPAAAAYEAALRSQPDLGGASYGLSEVRAAQGRFDDAIEIRRTLDAGQDAALDRLLRTASGATGWQRLGQLEARLGIAFDDQREAAGDYVAPIDRARLWARIGDATQAFRALDAALDVHDPGVVLIKADREWLPFRSDPRFQAAVAKIGLPA